MHIPGKSTAKALIALVDGNNFLFSRKNAPGKKKHSKLEMPGGRIDSKETPWQALKRELTEEDLSGILATLIHPDSPYDEVLLGNVTHYLFQLSICEDKLAKLRNNSESLGFVKITKDQVFSFEHLALFTNKTQKIWSAWAFWNDAVQL